MPRGPLPNTMRVPSGDQTGHPSGCASVVTRFRMLRAMSIVQISRFSGLPLRRATATWRSSGESDRLTSTPPSPSVPRVLPARSNHVNWFGSTEPPGAYTSVPFSETDALTYRLPSGLITLDHGNGIAGQLACVRIECLSHQRLVAREQHVAGGVGGR